MLSDRAKWWSLIHLGLGTIVLIAAAGLIAWSVLPDAGPAAVVTTSSPAPFPLYGVNLSLDYDDGQLNTDAPPLRSIGPEFWVRVRLHWADVEPARGRYVWDAADRLISEAERGGGYVLAVLETSPVWARRPVDAEYVYAPPAERRDFGQFVAMVAQRYGDVIDAYQIWDDPNIHPHWGSRYVSASEYVALLREGAIQVRSGDPGALVLAGGLSPTLETSGLNLSDIEFLRQMYDGGGSQWFDALAAKPYGLREAPDSPPDAGVLNYRRVTLLRQVMLDAGDGGKPIWAVEYGWNSLPDSWIGGPSPWGTIDEVTQVGWVGAAVDLARRDWPWLGPMLWADWQPALPPTDPRWGFAVLDPAGDPRAILGVLQSLDAGLQAAGAGERTFLDPAVTFEGDWRVRPDGADIGGEGDVLSIRFRGTGLDLVVRRGSYWAYLIATVDGEPANALPSDEDGRSYLVLHDPLAEEAVVPIASGLAEEGEHLARFEAHGGWDQWALKSFVVHGTEGRWAPAAGTLKAPALPIGLGAGAAALFWMAHLMRRRRYVSAVGWIREALQVWVVRWQGVSTTTRVLVLLAAGACYLFVPISPISLLGLLSTGILLVLWPHGGVVLAALAIPFFLHPPQVFGYTLPGAELLIWLTALALLLNRVILGHSLPEMARRFWRQRNWLDWGVAALLIAATLSTMAARHAGVAWHEWRVVIVQSALLYLLWRLLPGATDEDVWIRATLDALVAGGVAIALIGIGQRLLHVDLIAAEGVLRIRGPYGSPNNLSLYLERIIPIALAVAAFGAARCRRWLYGLGAVILLTALFLSYSRGAWLLGLPAALLVMGFIRGGKWRWGTLTLVVVLVVVLIPLAGTERITSLFDLSSGTAFFRLKLWRGAWNMVVDHLWLGVGPDNFLYEYRTRYVLPSAWEELSLSHPHNIVLDALTRLGIVGTAAFGVLLVALCAYLVRLAREPSAAAHRAWFLGLLGSMAAFLTHGLVDNSFFLADLALVCMMTAGIVARHLSRVEPAAKDDN